MPVHILGVTHHPGFENTLELLMPITRRQQLIILVTPRDVHLDLSHTKSFVIKKKDSELTLSVRHGVLAVAGA